VRFNGDDYDPALDDARLEKQLGRVWAAMRTGEWLTLRELATRTGDPEASVSAQLRHLRKRRFGAYIVEKRPRGARERGLYEYRVAGKSERAPEPRSLFDLGGHWTE